SGSGVLIYNTGSNYPKKGGTFGGISISGNGTIQLASATTGPYAGILVFQSRDNTRAISLAGKPTIGLNGAVYAPTAPLSISGNARENAPLIIYQISLSGNGTSTLTTDDSVSTSSTPGQLDAGNLWVYVDNSSGLFTSDQQARIQETIANIDTM